MGTEVIHQGLSKIRKVELRSIWPNEARHFTRWLAKHIADLGEALGIELETQERESPVGSRSLDTLATDGSGRPAVIENQLTSSDGDHLARILIYAAGKDADTIVWIARDFENAHWQVLQWLNQRTGTQTRFFGVAIEVWKIDDSRPAPHFRVVAAPNDWRKQNIVLRTPKKRYREFRRRLEKKLKESDLPLGQWKDHDKSWLAIKHVDGLNYSIDFPHRIYFSYQITTRSGRSLNWCRRAFDRLHRDRDQIESRLGKLEWNRQWKPNRGSTIISHYPDNYSDLTDPWAEVHDWTIDRYRLFREVFEPYREELMAL